MIYDNIMIITILITHYFSNLGCTRIDSALKVAEKEFYCSSCGVRKNIPQILFVLTDGASDRDSEPMHIATEGLRVYLSMFTYFR